MVPIMLKICELGLEEVSGDERDQHKTRRQLLILGQPVPPGIWQSPQTWTTSAVDFHAFQALRAGKVDLGDKVSTRMLVTDEKLP